MTDGAANLPPERPAPAVPVRQHARRPRSRPSGIQVLTIGFLSGSDDVRDGHRRHRIANAQVTKLLANMASPIKGVAGDNDNGCTRRREHRRRQLLLPAEGRRHQAGVPRGGRPARRPAAPHHRIDHRGDGTARWATACEPTLDPDGYGHRGQSRDGRTPSDDRSVALSRGRRRTHLDAEPQQAAERRDDERVEPQRPGEVRGTGSRTAPSWCSAR